MKTKVTHLVMLSTIVLLFSCHSKQESQLPVAKFNLDSARVLIEKQNIAFQTAFEQNDSAGLAKLYTIDGKFMMPGAPAIVGRAAIKKIVGVFMKMSLKRSAQTKEIWGDENLLVEEGSVNLSDMQGKELDLAKYLIVWKKEEGEWKIYQDMWNSNLPATK